LKVGMLRLYRNSESRARKGIIDFDRLMGLLGFETYEQLKQAHFKWVGSAVKDENKDRQGSVASSKQTQCWLSG